MPLNTVEHVRVLCPLPSRSPGLWIPPIIKAHNLRKEFKLGNESVETRRGEMVSIIGPSGSGKSILS